MTALALVLALQSADWKNGPSTDPAFFPVAVWLQAPRNAAAFKAAGINTYVGLHRGPTAAQLEALKAAGLKVICHQNELGLSWKDDPTIIGWMHGDEPDNAQPKAGGGYGPPILPERIQDGYAKLRQADPTRPVFLNLGQGVAYDNYIGRGVRRNKLEDYPEYLKGCDIASFDIYPAVHETPEIAGKLWYVPRGVERLRKWGGETKLVWNCIEAARIDNEKVKPTAAQIRTEVWMSLIHGSKGIVYFVHQFKPRFIEASLLEDPELLKGVTAINAQVRELAPALNSAAVKDGATVASSNAEVPIASTTKRHDGAVYVFAVAMRDAPARGTVSGLGAATSAEVLCEGRTIEVKNGSFQDEFKAYEVHLYRVK